ncbi:putative cyclopropane-fatty-acyl-phospholipid synthase [Helianthus annuus]|uniref:Putative mycolic acid cyclopropane synthase, S-adenosyl-L-methionine-dependent methyltransferase n=1 Tax=Helianthus annuus TaxID=4232 RepID=A0A251T050_HELAN|nr:putative cyclopropane-fatty-acyl-phospholipid synthase [Helianthus annuus]KAJ0492299.1 putative cyclopropane-fatty-acyl-phospholipid synthase [Helianthus annuus]KAJ0504573.1 putative cyclopropane-fatty-acyl-phospholipid synthase [Helianthus annuus]KAJ0674294.1 putative cyclopropane-fatty-acyl-phospholipid synthase [Helianthus annuus]KAJ0861952.1 putative cyclopropane-fatty-acyl-phospholipid synthase [Helianthus annuus]
MFTFEGPRRKSLLKVTIKVQNPKFYWKIVTKAEFGLADAYINGDFIVDDKNEGLLDMFTLRLCGFRGWWTPIILTAAISNAKHYYHYVMKKNTITQARRNISHHYDLSNEVFSLFLDETMAYSCAIFKRDDEDLKTAQERKISSLIKKAKVDKNHEVLEMGCGWGAFAIELVKQTGCKYTGITLSKEQMQYAENKVKEADLQDRIRFLLCDYRELPDKCKYNRIIGCEMVEHVGHEYYEEFFRCCESALAEDGILVLQFSSVPDGKYDEFRRTPGFIGEYIFPGGDLPSLNRLTSAMAQSSRLCVDHVEQIGTHYPQTIRCWRAKFLENQSKILALGFNQEFIRTWEYYFDSTTAGFKTELILNYQVVFSRPGNINATLGDPYKASLQLIN